MSWLSEIPELADLDSTGGLIRIPPELDVPLSPRVRQLIDCPEFRRLSGVSQLGLVSQVYPAAHHSRFEHSLGVYRLALLFLRQLARCERFCQSISPADAQVFLVAALLHDLGHWPFCHPIEDLRLPGVPQHELFANSFLLEGEVADTLRDAWSLQPREIVSLLSQESRDRRGRILGSLLSGPIDIDKMDYLNRDSLHAGVPYGRHFDQQRLIGSLCLNSAGDGLAITDKGRTAAEMMVFARYVMFSEVYWHHAVRSATAMLQRAFYLLYRGLDLDALFRLGDAAFVAELQRSAGKSAAAELLDGLFGPVRRLHKRVAQYSLFECRELYQQLARRPYGWLVACGEHLAALASVAVGRVVLAEELLLDAPPPEREIEFRVEVFFPKEGCYRQLEEVSPVVRTLAREQFDDYVKRVRLFAHPRVATQLRELSNLNQLVEQAIDRTGP